MAKFMSPLPLMLLAGLAALFGTTAPSWAATEAAARVSFCQHYLAAPPAAARSNAVLQTALGDCALIVGDADAAIAHYSRAVALEPAALKVRLQLAQVLVATGRRDEALRYLNGATRSNPGNPVALRMAAVAQEQAQIRPTDSLHGEMVLSRQYDSNINGGSSATSFDALIGGALVQLTLAEDSKGKPGWATVLGGGASYLHRVDANNDVVFRGDIAATIYDQHSDYSALQASAGIGLLHHEDRLSWSVMPNLRVAWENGRLDQLGGYVDGRASLAVDDRLSLNGFGKIGFTAEHEDRAGDHWSAVAGAGLYYALSDSVAGGVTLRLERHAANSAVLSFTKFGPVFYLEAALADGVRADVSYAYSKVGFDQTLPIFPAARVEDHHEISAGLTLDLSQWSPGLSIGARYAYRHIDSTVPFYGSDRHTLSTSLRYAF